MLETDVLGHILQSIQNGVAVHDFRIIAEDEVMRKTVQSLGQVNWYSLL